MRLNRIGVTLLSKKAMCQHKRTEVIARRDGVDYVRCLECEQIFDAEDLESVPVYDDEEESA